MNPLALLLSVWKNVITTVRKYPAVLIPFLWIAAFDVVLLAVLFLAPRPPFSAALAPIIRAFWGERFLHYPVNFLLLPQLFNYGKNILSFVTGLLFTGIALSMLQQAAQNARPDWVFGFQKALRRYLRLAVVWAVALGSIMVVIRAAGHVELLARSAKVFASLDFILNVALQMVFVFALPSIILENKKTLPSIGRSLALVKRYPLTTFGLVLVPSLLIIPLTYVYSRIPFLMKNIAPETALYVIVLRILTVTAIDFFVTASAAFLLLYHREKYDTGAKESLA